MKKIMCVVIGLAVLCVAGSVKAHAHCDTLDGPVVIDARIALKNKDVTPILKWVDKGSEEKIEEISKDTLEEISQNPNAKEATEMNFFSDLVRIHRTGEGASFEGLKSAGHVEPIVKAADEAIEKGSIDELNNMITEGAEKRFNRVIATIGHKDESVQEGREHVEAYVDFTHYVEELYNIASKSSSHLEHENDFEEHHEHNVLMTHT